MCTINPLKQTREYEEENVRRIKRFETNEFPANQNENYVTLPSLVQKLETIDKDINIPEPMESLYGFPDSEINAELIISQKETKDEESKEKIDVDCCSTEIVNETININENIETDNIDLDVNIGDFIKSEGFVAGGGCLSPDQVIRGWEIPTILSGSNDKTVGILDTGVDFEKIRGYNHVNWQFYPSQSAVHDDHGHGTAIASTIAELSKEFVVEKGGRLTIWIFKISHIENGDHSIKASVAIDRLRAACGKNCDAINLSFIFRDLSQNLQNILKGELVNCEKNAKIFMASGNIPASLSCTRACIPAFWANNGLNNSKCVSAVNKKGDLTISKCAGKELSCIFAPGFIFVQDNEWIGTSFATCVATAIYIMNGSTDHNFLRPPNLIE